MYSEALRNLETISDEIHQQRIEKRRNDELGVRGAGVGSETPSPPPCREHSVTEVQGMYSNVSDTSYSSSQGFNPPSLIYASPDKARNQSYRAAIENRTDDGDPDFPVPSLESEYQSLPSRSPNRMENLSSYGAIASSAYRNKGANEDSTEVFSTSPRDRTQSLLNYMSTSPRESTLAGYDSKMRSASLSESQYSTPHSGSPNNKSRKKLQAGGLILKIDPALDPLSGMLDTTQIKPTRLSQKSLTEKLGSRHKLKSQDSLSKPFESNSSVSTPGSSVGADFSALSVPGREKDDSDSESVVSTGPMLDDEQVEFLTMEFSDRMQINTESDGKVKDWGSRSLPPKLSHLEQYIHRRESTSDREVKSRSPSSPSEERETRSDVEKPEGEKDVSKETRNDK